MPSQTRYGSTVSVWYNWDVRWTNLNNILASDSNYASASLGAGQVADKVIIQGFNFSIPSNATILGIAVEAKGYKTGTGSVYIRSNALVDADNIWNDRVTNIWQTEDIYIMGGATDKWGKGVWYPSEINTSSFGTLFGAFTSPSTTSTVYIDYVRITVYYDQTPYTPSSAPTSNVTSPTTNQQPTFYGTFSDPDSGDTGYLSFEVRTGANGGGTLVASGNSSSGLTEGQQGSWTPSSSLDFGTYYIRYKRVDVSGFSSGWSPDFTLTIVGPVPKDLNLVWNIRSIAPKALQAYWNIRATLSKSLQVIWNVRKLATKSVQAVWNVIAFAGKNLALYWNTYAKYIAGIRFKQTLFKKARFRGPIPSNVVFKGVQILWNIRNLANKTAQLIWNQASSIYKKVDVVWNTCINATKDIALKWDIFLRVFKESSLVWNVRAIIAKTSQFIWQISGYTIKELTALWNTCINATKTQTLLWNINNLASKSTQLIWNIYKAVSKSIQTLWNVTGWIAKEVTVLWNDLISATKSNSFVWNVRALAIKTVQFVWNARKIVTKTVQTIWNVSGWVYKEFSSLWNIYLSAGLSRTFIWNISALVTKTRQLLWNITGWTYKAFSALWKIFSVIQFLDTNNVQLPTPWLLSSTKITPNTVVSNTFKIKNNSSSSLTDAKITIHDNFNHESLPASTTLLATGSTQLSTGTWTQVGYINGNYAYLTLGSFTSGEAKAISIKTQINQEGTFYARLHFEAMKGTTPVHADQIICVSYGTISVLKRPGEFRFKWPS